MGFCKASYNKVWKAANKEKVAISNKKYYSANVEKYKKYKVANRSKTKAADRLRKYGITAADHALMLKEQKNKCKICRVTFVNENDKNYKKCLGEYVDHCHTTNKVRGLLCHKCNTGLGHFKDNIKNLQRAINYLKEAA
tara:strand:- start:1845 stop:2261 length:417 start_codon:yes stop_codon:yes gene_type:complete